jgi:hypothetical protein
MSSVRGGLLLRTHLVELYHDAVLLARHGPGDTERGAQRSGRRSLLGQRSFSVSVPVASYDAAGAVQAFGQALGQLLDEVAAWAAQSAAVAGSRRSRRSSESLRSRCRFRQRGASCRDPGRRGETARSDHALHDPDLRRREELRHDVRDPKAKEEMYAAFMRYGADMQAAGVLRGGAELKPTHSATTFGSATAGRSPPTGRSPRPRSSSAATT